MRLQITGCWNSNSTFSTKWKIEDKLKSNAKRKVYAFSWTSMGEMTIMFMPINSTQPIAARVHMWVWGIEIHSKCVEWYINCPIYLLGDAFEHVYIRAPHLEAHRPVNYCWFYLFNVFNIMRPLAVLDRSPHAASLFRGFFNSFHSRTPTLIASLT